MIWIKFRSLFSFLLFLGIIIIVLHFLQKIKAKTMSKKKYLFSAVLTIFLFQLSSARIDPGQRPAKNTEASFRSDCASAAAQTDLAINNVRARLTTGGDLWWDGSDAGYIVPAVEGSDGVASIFAGGLWVGGVDPGGNLKIACQTYGHFNGNNEFWPGPLNDFGQTDASQCQDWDRFFKTTAESVQQHRLAWQEAVNQGLDELSPDMISDDIKGWPGLGNPFFFDVHGFDLPPDNQGFNGLADFYDVGGASGVYEPQFGDFPILGILGGCGNDIIVPDELIFWIINDAGGIHANTNGDPIQMEIQNYSFGFKTNNRLNDMTFHKYKMVNRAIENIEGTYIGVWVDADLGCYTDDYIGCDTSRSLVYTYNADALDGNSNCTDCLVNTYCEDIPVVGVDFLKGPLNEFGEILGMSSFTYYASQNTQPNAGMTDPQIAPEYYNYLSGKWRDGTPLTQWGTGYNPASTAYTNYAFPSAPDDTDGWSMCSTSMSLGDYRTIQAAGPFTLLPGAVNSIFTGVVWVPSMSYPCPDMTRFFDADDMAQNAFNNCFANVTSTQEVPQFADELATLQLIPNRSNVSDAGAAMIRLVNVPDNSSVNIYDLNGQLIRQYQAGSFSQTLEWDMTNQRGISIAKGVYLVQVITENGERRVLKFFGV